MLLRSLLIIALSS